MNILQTDSPIGLIELTEQDGCLVSLVIGVEPSNKKQSASPLLANAAQQLREYFAGARKDFDLPLKQPGTEFQQQAWNYLLTIPYGETVSYKDEAVAVGNAKASRAVGSANGKNALPIIIPCHRVVNADGKLGGYAYGLDMKKQLLALEAQNSPLL